MLLCLLTLACIRDLCHFRLLLSPTRLYGRWHLGLLLTLLRGLVYDLLRGLLVRLDFRLLLISLLLLDELLLCSSLCLLLGCDLLCVEHVHDRLGLVSAGGCHCHILLLLGGSQPSLRRILRYCELQIIVLLQRLIRKVVGVYALLISVHFSLLLLLEELLLLFV